MPSSHYCQIRTDPTSSNASPFLSSLDQQYPFCLCLKCIINYLIFVLPSDFQVLAKGHQVCLNVHACHAEITRNTKRINMLYLISINNDQGYE